MKRILLVIGLVLMCSLVSIAQDDKWKNVQALSSNQRIVVETKDGKTIKGKFRSGDEGKLSLLRNGKTVDIGKENVKRVFVSKKKRSVIGSVIGGLGGLFIVGSTVAAATRESDPGGYGGMAAGGAGLFSGAILGGKIGGKIKRAWLIYEAP